MRTAVWLGVAAAGGLGALLRFFVDGLVATRSSSELPLGTLAVNLSGALVLGALVGLALRGEALLLADTAAVGSYTTFSTWMLESHRLGEDGRPWLLLANLVLSLALGLGAAALARGVVSAL